MHKICGAVLVSNQEKEEGLLLCRSQYLILVSNIRSCVNFIPCIRAAAAQYQGPLYLHGK